MQCSWRLQLFLGFLFPLVTGCAEVKRLSSVEMDTVIRFQIFDETAFYTALIPLRKAWIHTTSSICYILTDRFVRDFKTGYCTCVNKRKRKWITRIVNRKENVYAFRKWYNDKRLRRSFGERSASKQLIWGAGGPQNEIRLFIKAPVKEARKMSVSTRCQSSQSFSLYLSLTCCQFVLFLVIKKRIMFL